jgi:hypothetical protein
MPISPTRARKLAEERENLLEMIDSAIMVEYATTKSPEKVVVEIPKETYDNQEIAGFLERVYQKAGWVVTFDKYSLGSSMYSHRLVLTEEKKKK